MSLDGLIKDLCYKEMFNYNALFKCKHHVFYHFSILEVSNYLNIFQSRFSPRLWISCTCLLWQSPWWNAQQWNIFPLHFNLDSCHKRRSCEVFVSGSHMVSNHTNLRYVQYYPIYFGLLYGRIGQISLGITLLNNF